MNVHGLTLGPLTTNCYLVWDDEADGALLIDCAGEPEHVLDAARSLGVQVRLIVNTHGHTDHTESLALLHELTGAEIAIHALDAPMLSDAMLSGAAMFGFSHTEVGPDRLLDEGDVIELPASETHLTVLHTPGHSPGSVCLLGEGVLFSGDCLFAGGIGRTDLPGGDERAMIGSLARLSELDPAIVVYPGHGPPTTIGNEVATNPWLAGF